MPSGVGLVSLWSAAVGVVGEADVGAVSGYRTHTLFTSVSAVCRTCLIGS